MVKLSIRKQIKKIGNSAGIILTKEELRLRRLKIGDVIDISDIVKIKSGSNK